MKIALISVGFVFAVLYLYFASRAGKLPRSLIACFLSGAGTYLALHFLSPLINVSVPLNVYALGFCTVLGLPGTVTFLLSNIIFL